MDVTLALIVILNAVKDLLYVFDPPEQITSRFFVAALLRMTLRQVPRAMGGKPTPSQIFKRDAEYAEFGLFFDQKLLTLRPSRLRDAVFESLHLHASPLPHESLKR